MSTTRTFPCCPACGRPFTRASGSHVAPDAPVSVAREVVYGGREPGRRGGSISYGRTFGPAEVTDVGVLSILTHWRHRLLHVAEVLGLVVERRVVVEVESAAMRERLVLLERRLSALTNRPDAEKPHRPRKRARVRAGAKRTASLSGALARVRAGGRREDGLGDVVQLHPSERAVVVGAGRRSEDKL